LAGAQRRGERDEDGAMMDWLTLVIALLHWANANVHGRDQHQ
jgi:hypothetical protein